jgi:hypothetical protein
LSEETRRQWEELIKPKPEFGLLHFDFGNGQNRYTASTFEHYDPKLRRGDRAIERREAADRVPDVEPANRPQHDASQCWLAQHDRKIGGREQRSIGERGMRVATGEPESDHGDDTAVIDGIEPQDRRPSDWRLAVCEDTATRDGVGGDERNDQRQRIDPQREADRKTENIVGMKPNRNYTVDAPMR